ncbi:hypothetical protein PSM36_2713 [Proteiniphilum saccharofermentans]|jgi:hypothetical protein|uniref:Uncharacterized protein n=1 Tax=Proteiniphilum saccharofermentans TaxID=1642647 RepID=A0A1R3T5Z0_9BACT|nr:DUF3826 domain-containing protein [Proteiniphilum saccharofermentans]SCD21509.1 hypothetical protein PSM36_2713 [Proteiniphilum saccharofermentans]SDZ84337.1 Protein of unknown function [Porphyromonadaceae bacterium KH3R12]SFS91311.1 Protein of unknown function [Porphyromonadaceae bacterium NLAE-zl-C104]SFU60356.1 Protein of unknown function [Porphyromonadaceae bacterium KHP3R9]
MTRYIFLIGFILFGLISVNAQKAKTPEDIKYLEVLSNRSDKILDQYVRLPEGEIKEKVRDLMVKQYWDLNKIHDRKDRKIEELKQSGLPDEKFGKEKSKLENKAEKKLQKLQKKYLRNLSKYLNKQQIDGVKDGMTLGAFDHNYRGFTELIPSLKQDEKEYVYNQLVEARDKAMNMGSSEDKQAVFRQYKGKINNYLSQQGYDLDQERIEWNKRIEEAKRSKM